jgi:hypothetical protein
MPPESASGSASVTAPAGAAGVGGLALLALLLLIAGKAPHFRFHGARKGVLLAQEFPSG